MRRYWINVTVLHWSVSYWEVYPAKLFYIHDVNTSRLKLNFEKGVFDDVHNKLVSTHISVTSNVLAVIDENYERRIFQILQAIHR